MLKLRRGELGGGEFGVRVGREIHGDVDGRRRNRLRRGEARFDDREAGGGPLAGLPARAATSTPRASTKHVPTAARAARRLRTVGVGRLWVIASSSAPPATMPGVVRKSYSAGDGMNSERFKCGAILGRSGTIAGFHPAEAPSQLCRICVVFIGRERGCNVLQRGVCGLPVRVMRGGNVGRVS